MYLHLPIKYLLAASPAIIFLLLEHASSISYRTGLLGASLLVTVGIAYSWLLLEADARFANVARQASKVLITPHTATGEKIWSAGQWGFYWYASQAGASVSKPEGPAAQPGDRLAIGYREGGTQALERFPRRSLVQVYSESCSCGRTVADSAAFYSNLSGIYALWSWETGEVARYQLWRIE